jgi:predicted ribosomally synthesized peptide with SipW-like signal peptide
VKKILGLAIAAIIVIAIAAVGTYAYFSDTETSTGNTITAGTLNLTNAIDGTSVTHTAATMTKTDGTDGANDSVQFANVAPADSGTVKWILVNTGTLPGKLSLAATDVFGPGSENEPELAASGNDVTNGNLGANVQIRLQRGQGADQAAAETAATSNYLLGSSSTWANLSELAAKLSLDSGANAIAMSASNATTDTDTVVYILSWQIDGTTVGNVIQGDTATENITFTLDQNHT